MVCDRVGADRLNTKSFVGSLFGESVRKMPRRAKQAGSIGVGKVKHRSNNCRCHALRVNMARL